LTTPPLGDEQGDDGALRDEQEEPRFPLEIEHGEEGGQPDLGDPAAQDHLLGGPLALGRHRLEPERQLLVGERALDEVARAHAVGRQPGEVAGLIRHQDPPARQSAAGERGTAA
jgi:hypothetical protein